MVDLRLISSVFQSVQWVSLTMLLFLVGPLEQNTRLSQLRDTEIMPSIVDCLEAILSLQKSR